MAATALAAAGHNETLRDLALVAVVRALYADGVHPEAPPGHRVPPLPAGPYSPLHDSERARWDEVMARQRAVAVGARR